MKWFAWCVMFLMVAVGAAAAEVQVFAAASLTDALQEIAAQYERSHPDRIVFNFAASSLLARQITEGAPADLFFSADEAKMDSLQVAGLIVNATRKTLLSNTLVIVVPSDSAMKVEGPASLATSTWKIALAEPNSVPAGIYAKQYLEKMGVWAQVQDRVVPTDNVRAALAAVESGNVDAGIVYRTDAGISKRVKIAYEVPAKDSPEIRYSLAVTSESKNREAAGAFAAYLASAEAAAVFTRYGFLTQHSVLSTQH